MKRKTVIAAASVAVIGGAMYMLAGRREPDAAGLTQYKVEAVQVGSVRKTVSATGTLQPWKTVDIKSKAGGRVLEMLVDVGTPVTKGQIIARIDPSDTLLAVNQARADIDAAAARKDQSERTYQLQVEQSEIAVRNAEAALQSARSSRSAARVRLDTAKRQAANQPSLTDAAITQARASLSQAIDQRAQLDATNQQARASAQSAYDQAVANAKNVRANLERQGNLLAKGFVSQQEVDNARASAEVAQAQVTNAKAKLDTLEPELRANVEVADSRVAQARAALKSAETNRADIANRQDEVRQAEAALKQAESQLVQAEQSLRQAKANRATNAIRKLDIASAEATITRSEATRQNAEETLNQTTVRAPSEGVILTKYVDEGTIITSGLSLTSTGSSIVQLGDTTRMFVDVNVDEADIASVEEGQNVEISMDAYPGIPFEGVVSRVDPQAVVEQNVTMIHVRVELDNSSPTFRLLKPGMNATCDFIVESREDVLSVPTIAVQSGREESFVEVATGGRPAPPDPETGRPADDDTLVGIEIERRSVETGLEGDETTELISGVKEGDVIVVQTIRPIESASRGGSPFGGGGPGGGRRR